MNKKLTKKNKYLLPLIILLSVLFFFIILIIGLTIYSASIPDKILSNQGEILKKKKEVYYNVKVPEFNHYFIILNKSGDIKKLKVNQLLFNLYQETDSIEYDYSEKSNEILKVNRM